MKLEKKTIVHTPGLSQKSYLGRYQLIMFNPGADRYSLKAYSLVNAEKHAKE